MDELTKRKIHHLEHLASNAPDESMVNVFVEMIDELMHDRPRIDSCLFCGFIGCKNYGHKIPPCDKYIRSYKKEDDAKAYLQAQEEPKESKGIKVFCQAKGCELNVNGSCKQSGIMIGESGQCLNY